MGRYKPIVLRRNTANKSWVVHNLTTWEIAYLLPLLREQQSKEVNDPTPVPRIREEYSILYGVRSAYLNMLDDAPKKAVLRVIEELLAQMPLRHFTPD